MDQSENASHSTHKTLNPAPPCLFIIFGIAGDLTKRLLFPALCNLGSAGLLNENFSIVGIARKPYDTASFAEQLKKDIEEFISDPAAKEYGLKLVKTTFYISGEFNDVNVYSVLKDKLAQLSVTQKTQNYLFYFAAPPESMMTIATHLKKADLLSEKKDAFRRLVVEKPFGHDLMSAKKLNKSLLSMVNEKQIFRVDHFLGKETVQNILAFRFSNGLFEPLWNNLYIDHVQITVAEELGVELRGNYYEGTGALRDMVPNHLFQMLCLITMEPPSSFSADNIQAEKEKVLSSVKRLTPEQVLTQVIRGQYAAGKIENKDVIGYRSEPRVAADSSVETFVALKLFLDNWRWLNVPFYLRTGKRMTARQSEIIVQFKAGPSTLFNESDDTILPNLLRLFIQPEEGISLRFNAKIPGPAMELDPVNMRFKYSDYFGIKPQTGYETILYEAMTGDHLLFNQGKMVETEWEIVQPILDVWESLTPRDFPNYAAGSCGPKAADELIQKDGRKWIL